MKLRYLLPLLLLGLSACNKPDKEPVASIAGSWRFQQVLNYQNMDITQVYDSVRLELGAKEAKLYKLFVKNGNLVDSLIADGIYSTYWGMEYENVDPTYPDSLTEVQYQKIDFTWADAPPYPYYNSFWDWRINMSGPDHLYTEDFDGNRYFLEP